MYKLFGIIAIIMALMLFGQYEYGAALFCAALGAVFLTRPKKKKPKKTTAVLKERQIPQPAAPVVPKIHTSVRVGGFDGYAVAGVTYKNEDGSERQQILSDLCGGKKTGSVLASLEEYEYNGSPAVRVMTELGCVGNIRRGDVEEVLDELASGAREISLEIETFVNEKGRTIYRADVYFD